MVRVSTIVYLLCTVRGCTARRADGLLWSALQLKSKQSLCPLNATHAHHNVGLHGLSSVNQTPSRLCLCLSVPVHPSIEKGPSVPSEVDTWYKLHAAATSGDPERMRGKASLLRTDRYVYHAVSYAMAVCVQLQLVELHFESIRKAKFVLRVATVWHWCSIRFACLLPGSLHREKRAQYGQIGPHILYSMCFFPRKIRSGGCLSFVQMEPGHRIVVQQVWGQHNC